MDADWTLCTEPHERVRWARIHAGFPTMQAAADSLGERQNTYSSYEREPGSSRTARLNDQRAIQFGRKFRVSWRWLLTGEGTPFTDVYSEPQERVVKAMAEAPLEQQEAVARAVEALLKAG